MITDKDREVAKIFCEKTEVVLSVSVNGVRRPDEIRQIFNTPENIENLASFISRTRTEAAEQARKAVADSETLSDIRRICEIITGNNFGNHELDSLAFHVGHHPDVLSSTVNKGKTDAEKLDIAEKALEYVASKSLPSGVFESHYSRLQDACAKASDALKEIQ